MISDFETAPKSSTIDSQSFHKFTDQAILCYPPFSFLRVEVYFQNQFHFIHCRLSFSEATTSEESQTSEKENSVGDEGESQESGSSSEGTVKAPSSQSELSQDEGDGQTETEEDDASGPVEE